jgi:hypothetical protein
MADYETFNRWLFDGSLKSELPEKDVFLSYKSPIVPSRLISSFMLYGELNHYLNKYFNNMGLHYIEKEDIFKFIKKCIIDFKIRRNNLSFIKTKKDSNLFQGLRKKFPTLKGCDIEHLCSVVENMEDNGKRSIYDSLGLIKIEAPKRVKKSLKKIVDKSEKIKIKDWLETNFSVVRTK